MFRLIYKDDQVIDLKEVSVTTKTYTPHQLKDFMKLEDVARFISDNELQYSGKIQLPAVAKLPKPKKNKKENMTDEKHGEIPTTDFVDLSDLSFDSGDECRGPNRHVAQ